MCYATSRTTDKSAEEGSTIVSLAEGTAKEHELEARAAFTARHVT